MKFYLGYHSITGYVVREANYLKTLRYGLDLRPGGGWEVRDKWGQIAAFPSYAEMESALRGWGIKID